VLKSKFKILKQILQTAGFLSIFNYGKTTRLKKDIDLES